MPISQKISQYRALLSFVYPGDVLWSGPRSRAQAGNMAGFYTPNSCWLSLGARDWSPRTKWQSIIGGSPRGQAARRISPPILTCTTHGHELKGGNVDRRGCAGWRRIKREGGMGQL